MENIDEYVVEWYCLIEKNRFQKKNMLSYSQSQVVWLGDFSDFSQIEYSRQPRRDCLNDYLLFI